MKIRVNTEKPYEIRIGSGILAELGGELARLGGAKTVVLVTDETVDALYGDAARESLSKAGFAVTTVRVPGGESAKNLAEFGKLLDFFAEAGLTRSDLVVALGGGSISDLAGFAAAVYARGLRYVNVPTTLLAAVDASVGGKTGIDLRAGKNLAGAFHQPAFVFTDVATFRTLPEREMRNGLAEVLKAGVIGSPALFGALEKTADPLDFQWLVREALRVKIRLVEADERDEGARMLLNFGHTLGHAIEAASGYAIPHGEAVSIGMAVFTTAAVNRGITGKETAERLFSALRLNGLPAETPFTITELLPHLEKDKKKRADSLTVALPKRIGSGVLVKVPFEDLQYWLHDGGLA